MLDTSVPAKFAIPFANSAGPGAIRPVPQASQIGVQNGAASLTDGFPPNCFIPIAGGGSWPFGQDFNGLLNQVTAWERWIAAGGPIYYDATFATAIGGYPKGATVMSTGVTGVVWTSTVNNNTTNPDTGGAGWTLYSSIVHTWVQPQTYAANIILNNNVFLMGKGTGGGTQGLIGMGADNFLHMYGGSSGWVIGNNAATANNVIGDDLGNVVIRAGVQSSSFDSGGLNFRTTSTNYGAGWRNDNADLYLLLTNNGSPAGAFNLLRPLIVHLSTGAVTLDATGAGGVITGGNLTVNGAGGISSSGPISSNGAISAIGNVTGSRLRAALGATGSGDANCATILSDFTRAYTGTNSGFTELPDGTIELVTTASISAGGGLVTTIVALPPGFFPTNILEASVCFLGNTPPGPANPGAISIQPNSPTTVAVTANYANAQVLGVQIKARGF